MESPEGDVEPLRHLVAAAEAEARALGHGQVGTEHMLLALLGQVESVASDVLDELRCNRDDMRAHVISIIGRKDRQLADGPGLPVTVRGQQALDEAESAARDFKTGRAGAEHLLLGLLRERHGLGGQILVESGVTLERAQSTVQALMER